MRRCPMSESDVREVWTRRQRGETYRAIGQAFGRDKASIFWIIRTTGGVPPRARYRAARTVSRAEREEISRGLAAGDALAAIGRRLGRPTCTISREVQRHGGGHAYRADVADGRAWTAARRPKACRLATRPRLRALVAARLAQDWSPQQIAAWLRARYPDNPDMQVSHETIYLSLFVQSRGVLKRALLQHLRRRHRVRRPRRRPTHSPERILDALSIRERPASADDRAVPGHWEGDLLMGARRTRIATLVERHSRYVMLVRLPQADSPSIVQALARRIRTLPTALRQSLTWDRGTELAAHKAFTVATNVQVYFCDPQSPWQRGSNENTNGLLRQYFPKGTDVSAFTQPQLNAIARRLNTRPRATLGFETPAARLAASVASTA
jgi:IS30 family transposase